MFKWIELTPHALEDYVSQDYIALFTPEESPETLLANLIDDTCLYIRTFVPPSWIAPGLPANYLPDTCKSLACTLVLEALQMRFPELARSQDQMRAADQARQTLNQFQELWGKTYKESKRHHRIEAVRHRPIEVQAKTLRGF